MSVRSLIFAAGSCLCSTLSFRSSVRLSSPSGPSASGFSPFGHSDRYVSLHIPEIDPAPIRRLPLCRCHCTTAAPSGGCRCIGPTGPLLVSHHSSCCYVATAVLSLSRLRHRFNCLAHSGRRLAVLCPARLATVRLFQLLRPLLGHYLARPSVVPAPSPTVVVVVVFLDVSCTTLSCTRTLSLTTRLNIHLLRILLRRPLGQHHRVAFLNLNDFQSTSPFPAHRPFDFSHISSLPCLCRVVVFDFVSKGGSPVVFAKKCYRFRVRVNDNDNDDD